MLATQVVERRIGQDTLVYPILFLYRQYIELALKEIIRSGMVYLERDRAAPKHHDLGQLWAMTENLLDEICPGDSVSVWKERMAQRRRLVGVYQDWKYDMESYYGTPYDDMEPTY